MKRRSHVTTMVLRPVAFAAIVAVGLRRLVGLWRLRERHRRLTEREEAKSALLRLAAHEVRTPLALARGYVEMVRSETLGSVSGPAREALATVDERLREIDELAAHMVEAARLQDGEPQLHLELLDMRELLREAAERTRALADAAHPVVLDEGRRPVPVVADRMRLRVVLTNLISNAIKYSPEGGDVRCGVSSEDGSASVRVTDRGVGIDPTRMKELFGPFTRLHSESAPGIKGLGLGLYLSREIARAHHGELSAQPNRGPGTTFLLRLPEATVRESAVERRHLPPARRVRQALSSAARA